MTTPDKSPFDVAELSRLANEFFASLPGGADPSAPPAAPTSAAPPASAAEVAVPTDTASASALAGGLDPAAVPAPLAGPPADTALRSARVASPDVNTPPVPTLDQLAAVHDLVADLLSLVPSTAASPLGTAPKAPATAPVATTAPAAASAPASAPTGVPGTRSASSDPGYTSPVPGGWLGGDATTTPEAPEIADLTSLGHPPVDAPSGLGLSGVVPGAVPGEGAATDAAGTSTGTSQETLTRAAAAPAAQGYAPTTAAAPVPAAAAPAPAATPAPLDHSGGLPSSAPTSSVSVFEFRPEMLPSLSGTRVAARPFDPYAIRRDFPILSETVNGRPLIWLDNGATTQKPQAVIDRVSSFYEHENSNIHRAAHTLAARSTDAYEGAREKVRRFLNAGSAAEIVFVRGTTEGINLVAKTWGAKYVGSGDEILITHLEHHANIVPWQQLAQQVGATLKVAPVDDSGQIILSEFERLITPRTKVAALTQVSNALGTTTPSAEMVEIARRHGVTTLVDAAQSVLHMPVDVQALDADFVVFSGHKVFAPTGIGVVYGKADVWADTPPWQGGGNMIADVTFERTVYQPAPNRFEAGTGNIADAVGLGAALDYVTSVGLHNVSAYEHELLGYGTEGLLSIPGLRIIGTAKNKAAVMSFVLDGYSPEQVGVALDRDGIAVRAGHHCAQPILRRFGVEATVRPSLAMYNTREDLDCLVQSLRRLQAGQLRGS